MKVTLSLLPLATTAGAAIATIDAIVRLRKGGGLPALLALVELGLGLLLFVAAFAPVKPYVTTTIPTAYLVIPLAVVLIASLMLPAVRKTGRTWLTGFAAAVVGITAVLTVVRFG